MPLQISYLQGRKLRLRIFQYTKLESDIPFILNSLPFSISVSQMDRMKWDPVRNFSCLTSIGTLTNKANRKIASDIPCIT